MTPGIALFLGLAGTGAAHAEPIAELASPSPVAQDASADPQDAPDDSPQDLLEDIESDEPIEREARGYQMQVGLRYRRYTIPDALMDQWYFDIDDDGYPSQAGKRPSIAGNTYGFEFSFIEARNNHIIWFEYLDSEMDEGYWDDRNEDPIDHLDGHYVLPSDNFGFILFGYDYLHEVPIVRPDQTHNKAFGLSFVVGAGLGLGIMLGELENWKYASGTPGYLRYQNGDPADGVVDMPLKAWPWLTFQAGFQMLFGERVALRLEGGVHNGLFYGGTLGVRF